MTFVLSLLSNLPTANCGILEGIGYREQQLQVAKGTKFASETPNGISWASFNGGTNIFIKGDGLNDNPAANTVFLKSNDLSGLEFQCPPLNEDDTFNSNPMLGFITYKLPSLEKLIGVPEILDSYKIMSFDVYVMAQDELAEEGQAKLACHANNQAACRVFFRKDQTPVVYGLEPPVVYFGSTTNLWFDPKGTMGLIVDLIEEQKPFINAKVGGALIDFDDFVTFETTYGAWVRNYATGIVGDQLPSKSQDISMLWETGQASQVMHEVLHCSYDNSTCYQAKTVPVIFGMNAHTGYKTGGSNLTVFGKGFNSPNIHATVDDQNCTVTRYNKDSFSCEVQPRTDASIVDVPSIGSHGLRMVVMNSSENLERQYTNIDKLAVEDMQTNWTRTESLALSLEQQPNIGDRYAKGYYGWFIPPETTRYRFYMTCDDYCEFFMNLEPGKTDNKTQLLKVRYASNFRDYWRYTDNQNRTSDWVTLTKGEPYYIETLMREDWSGDHLSVAVEIEQTSIVNHHHAMKEIQQLSIDIENNKDTSRITIDKPDGGQYILNFQDPVKLTYKASSKISTNATAQELCNTLRWSWSEPVYGSNLDCELTMYDAAGLETTVLNEVVKRVYLVKLRKLISGPSASNILVAKSSTTSTIVAEKSSLVQLSSTPLSGNYKIKCTDSQGVVSYSNELEWSTWNEWINQMTMEGCAHMYDKLEVMETYFYPYKQNGVNILLRFTGLHEKPGQFEIVSSETKPLVGDNLTFSANVTQPYSTNLFYEPVPFEFLRTYETKPQLIVHVDGEPVVCHNLTCDFVYTEPVGEVSAFTFDPASKKLVLTGTNLPDSVDQIRKITFSQQTCSIDPSTISATNIECILDNEPTCGDWLPQLVSNLGIIPNAASLTPSTVTCVVSSAVPVENLNLLGGDNITISGQFFPNNLETHTVSLKFSDAQATECVPQVSSTSTLVCLTNKFDKVASGGATLNLSIIINGQTISNSLSFGMRSQIKSGTSISPSSASPVLKTLVTIALEQPFPATLDKHDFSVNLTSTTNSTIVKRMNVVAVDDSAKTIQCMFGGAESDTFTVGIRHSTLGLVGTEGLTFQVKSTVSSVTPKTGSINGGTVLTIIGENFGTVITDNPVQISYNGGVGSTNCYVLTTEATKITCRVDDTIKKDAGESGTVIVFLKTSEEAVCDSSVCGGFQFTNSLAEITSLATATLAGEEIHLKITGTNMPSSGAKLMVDGVEQTFVSGTSTEVVFAIKSAKTKDIKPTLYVPEGKALGHELYLDVGVYLPPFFTKITPNVGSVGGTAIIAHVPGVGSSETVDILNASGASICDKVSMKGYGQIECITKRQTIASQVLKVKVGATTITCVDTGSTCNYEQAEAGAFPAVSSVSIGGAGTQIIFTGTDFYTSGYSAEAIFNGIKADTTTVDSSTQVTATWTDGVPVVAEATKPDLKFTAEAELKTVFFAVMTSTLENAISISSSTTGLTCSFAGGCLYEITSTGLSQMLKQDPENNYVSFCQNKAVISQDSTATVAKVILPSVSTEYSDSSFGIQTARNLKPFKLSSSGTSHDALFDGDLFTQNLDNSNPCFIDMEFREGYIGVLDKVKYYLAVNRNKEQYYVDHLKFSGSDDGTTWTEIFTADLNAHTGWNYVEWMTPELQPKFKKFRFSGDVAGSCVINEIQLHGFETIEDEATSYSCDPKLVLNGIDTPMSGSVLFSGAKTAALTSISPRYGRVEGGDSVTFTGTDFSDQIGDYTILLDKIPCIATAANSTSVTCTTGKRPGIVNPSMSIMIAGKGFVSLKGMQFKYVNLWSSDETWSGEFAPVEGDSVFVPKGLNLLVDVDSTPLLNAILVEGSLIFAPNDSDPTHHRTFDAKYIFVQEGRLEVGTEDYPYTSKITITMHGKKEDPYLPTYGNKVIGVRMGNLDMHGPVRTPTWTTMEKTEERGAKTITLRVAVDWQVGEQIAIAPTSFEVDEAEKRFITAIDRSNPDKPVLTLDKPLEFKHFAKTQYFGTDEFDMRAEVGLLSRNVVFRGDPETSEANEYGATIFLHSMGDDSLTARLSYIELNHVGQAFKLGRYAVHFHMIGNVHNSYVKGNSVHEGFNRAFTFHGTSYLRLTDNVVYNVKGHNIFIEDAVERHNQIHRNLVMKTKRSWSLLNTDQTPASFWITNPNNDFTENHAAGSDRYSYWFDLQIHAMGPSADVNICPENEPLGMFRNNHAHSNGRYGLRIFHNLMPRTFPCKAVVYDPNNSTDPFWKNPLITANFYNLTSWKNKRNGAIVGAAGDVRFNNFKVADNFLAGLEMERSDRSGDGKAMFVNSTIVGRTENTEQFLDWGEPRGVITPRSENFTMDGLRFYNFNWNRSAAIGTCSHCFHPAATDSGARTVTVKNLWFDSSVTRRIWYQFPYLAIINDKTGTLTEKGPDSWAMGFVNHNTWPECTVNKTVFDGHVCDSTHPVRRLAFHDFKDQLVLKGMQMFILPYDDDLIAAQPNVTEYELNRTNYGMVKFKDKQDPLSSWTFPFVTGHKYKIHWANTGVDFTQMTIQRSERAQETDPPIYLIHNFSDVRALMEVSYNSGKVKFQNNSLPSTDINDQNFITGQNLMHNETLRRFQIVINGKNNSYLENRNIKIVGSRCVGPCMEDIKIVATEGSKRYWSNPKDWPSGAVPREGEDVHVEPGWDMIFDLQDSPVYRLIRVNGILTFTNSTNTHLRCKHLFVRAGELHIGTKEQPYPKQARITLFGSKEEEAIVYDNAIEGGNKLIANVNKISMWGMARTKTVTRLTAEAQFGANSFKVEPGLDIVAGDRLGLSPTSYELLAADYVHVTSYDNITGLVTINSTLLHYHWGAPTSTASKYNGVDIRGEVMILSRNIIISGENIEGWGGQIVTSDTIEGDLTVRYGSTIMNNVEVYNCSQVNTLKAAIRFEGAAGAYSHVSNCSFHNGLGWGVNILNSANVRFEGNTVFSFKPIGVGVMTARNITIHNNIVSYIYERDLGKTEMFVDWRAGMTICGLLWDQGDKCFDISVTNNIVAGAAYAGYVVPGHKCGQSASQQEFRNNIAHSLSGFKGGVGAVFFPNNSDSEARTCYEGSHFAAYKCNLQGATQLLTSLHMIYTNMTAMDNLEGIGMQIHMPGDDQYKELLMEMNDMVLFGETEIPDCPDKERDFCIMAHKFALFPPAAAIKGKAPHINSASALPMIKIKGDSSWGGRTKIRNATFIGFKAKTHLGLDNSIFGSSDYQPDYTPMLEFSDSTFIDIEEGSLAHFQDPKPEWAVISDCGQWPCTGPQNILYAFKNSKWQGEKPALVATDFQLIHDNPGFADHVKDCIRQPLMNAYFCTRQSLGILHFESQDEDRMDRSVQPVMVNLQGTKMNNTMNAEMDHTWDGFYTGQLRQTRFPAVVDAFKESTYDITYTGTPPKKQLFELYATGENIGMLVRIAYPDAVAYSIQINGKYIEMNQWSDLEKNYAPIKRSFCGENRYLAIKNILEFYITTGCSVKITPRNAIMSKVRMEWTIEDFYAKGGTTSFVDRLAASLGIHASTIKIVGVYQGSLVVDYNIFSPNDDSSALKAVESKQTEQIATGVLDLGAPILDFVANKAPVVTDGIVSAQGYKPVKLTPTVTNANYVIVNSYQELNQVDSAEKGVFKPDIQIVEQDENKFKEVITTPKAVEKTTSSIVLVSLLILIVVIFSFAIRLVLNYLKAQAIDQQRISSYSRDQNANNDFSSRKKAWQHDETEMQHNSTIKKILDETEQQYDPNQDFTIFSHADPVSKMKKVNFSDSIEKSGSTAEQKSSGSSSANNLPEDQELEK